MRLILIMISLVVSMGAAGQTGLNVAKLFDGRYRNNPNASETIMSGEPLKQYKFELFHSVELKNMPEEADTLEQLVMKDGASAINKEVKYVGGHLYAGFYQLPPVKSMNRYLFYLNKNLIKEHKILMIYIEARVEWSDVRQFISVP